MRKKGFVLVLLSFLFTLSGCNVGITRDNDYYDLPHVTESYIILHLEHSQYPQDENIMISISYGQNYVGYDVELENLKHTLAQLIIVDNQGETIKVLYKKEYEGNTYISDETKCTFDSEHNLKSCPVNETVAMDFSDIEQPYGRLRFEIIETRTRYYSGDGEIVSEDVDFKELTSYGFTINNHKVLFD